jgi:ABC-type dipeptide/oligopeptide/nickel transport system ATPase subunit
MLFASYGFIALPFGKTNSGKNIALQENCEDIQMATIAVSGKGGSGKTTIAALMIRIISAQTGKPVLGVDADPNACLG